MSTLTYHRRMPTNQHGLPIGPPLGGWSPPPYPPARPLLGRTVSLKPMDPAGHGPGLWRALGGLPESVWTYMSFGPFEDAAGLRGALESMCARPDRLPYTIFVDDQAEGFASYLRITPAHGVIEVGSIVFSDRLKRTTAATEALYLMIRNVFELGYRRCEWKCDDLNAASRRAAERLGFTYEGTFRKAIHYKGRSRNTAWYAITDDEWPQLDSAFVHWLDPDNFTDTGAQKSTLEEMRGRRSPV